MRSVDEIRRDLAVFDTDAKTDMDVIFAADGRLLDDIPDLLAEVERLRAALQECEAVVVLCAIWAGHNEGGG